MSASIPERLKKYDELLRQAEQADRRAAKAQDLKDKLHWQNQAWVCRAAANAIAGDLKRMD
jgi:hypothetical protein